MKNYIINNMNIEDEIRNKVIEQLTDLIEKIEKNEPFPESEQNTSDLIDISDNLDICLNKWYY